MEDREGLPLPFLKKGIAQIALVVADLDKTVERFYAFFGVGPWDFYTYEKPLVKEMSRRGRPASYRMRIALANLGPMRIELIQQLSGDTVYQEFIEKHGYGVHHVGILVEDMSEALRAAESSGIKMTQDGSGFGLDGDGHYAYLDTESLIGTTVELIERPKGRMKPEKTYPS